VIIFALRQEDKESA